jgi:nifR3 family TIM-barrel protein
MNDLPLAGSIIRETVKRIRKPVTVKIRKGFDQDSVNAVEAAKVLEDAGAAAIAVHGRTREQFYSGKADWEIIRQVKEAVSIPVFGNGDIDSPLRAEEMLAQTGADGVMIARAARGNPWIFSKTRTYFETGSVPEGPSGQEILATILRHMQMLTEIKGEYIAIREMRKHIAWYTTGLPGAAALRRRINETENTENIIEMLREYLPD